MKQLLNNLIAFYLTIGVPLVYSIGLWLVAQPNTVNFVGSFRLMCLVLSFVGMGIWAGSYISLGKYFGVLPKIKTPTHKGLYKYLKHPMYMGIMLTYLGLSVANQSKIGIVFTIFILGPLLALRTKLEEKKLKNPDTISLKN